MLSENTNAPQNEQQVTRGSEEPSWAMDLLRDYKKSSKRWFIAFMTTLILLFIVVGGTASAVAYVLLNYDIGVVSESVQDSEGNNYNVVSSDGVTFGPDSQSN